MTEVRPSVMPNSIEAERSVLGAMLLDRAAAEKAAEDLTQEDFYDPGHREIFDAMLALFKSHRPVDITTLDTELTRRGSLEGIGGSGYLVDLTQMVPTTANVAAYIQIVSEMSTRRRLIAACNEISQESYSQRDALPETLDHAEKAIFDIAMKRSSSEALMPIREVLFPTYAIIEELSRNKGGISGVPSGYHDLDNLLTGMHGGELILIGARPSMGKTSFAIGIALNAAMLYGKRSPSSAWRCPGNRSRCACSAPRRGWTCSGSGRAACPTTTGCGWPTPSIHWPAARSTSTTPPASRRRSCARAAGA